MRTILRGLFTLTLLALILLGASQPGPVGAAGVVGDGTPASCTEAALRAALDSGGLVTFNCGGNKTILLESQLAIRADTVMDGDGQITLSGNNTTRIFHVTGGNSLTVRDMTLTNGYAVGYGGAVYVAEGASFTADSSTIGDSQTDGFAGSAIFAIGDGAITLRNSIVQNNRTTSFGAVNSTGPVTIENSVLRGNHSDAGGGALSVSGNVTITGSRIEGNRTEFMVGHGGGIYVTGPVEITDSHITGNFSGKSGGGIFATDTAIVTVNGSIISDNFASDGSGGGVDSSGVTYLNNSTIRQNRATYEGGGIFSFGSQAFLGVFGSTISQNYSGPIGGGVYISGQATFENTTISHNSTGQGGGGLYISSGVVTFTNVTFNDNSSNFSGRNLHVSSQAKATVSNTIFASPSGGGNCYVFTGNAQNPAGQLVSGGFNLDTDGTCGLKSGGDLEAPSAGLGELRDNGGDTWTHLPHLDSAAVDGGTCAGGNLAVDQRGAPRPAGNACDIGAVERQPGDGIYYSYVGVVIR